MPTGEEQTMEVLVAYASRHGATAGIAERIATGLRAGGLSAEAVPVTEVSDVERYDAFVIGSAAYLFHWLKDATRFVKRHRALLADRPVWLFSSGPLGTDRIDEQGEDVLEATRPKEFDALTELVHPRGVQVFFGAWDPDAARVGLTEQLVRRIPAAAATPAGDFRDWAAIDAWSAAIARELLDRDVAAPAGP
jgi:menaquinone-dependent protoporphyrinogen oxidase